MSIELIVGPPNSGRSEAILARFRAELGRDPVLVVPTAGDVAAFERELAAQGATLGGSIATFDALAAEIAGALAPALDPELTVSQRQALVRAAIDSVDPGRLRRSAARPGFAPALARLIAELEAALVSPREFAAIVDELDDAGYERELARFYSRYVELREASGRGDRATTLAAAIRALRDDPDAWRARPVYVYGFDDLTRAQRELVDALAGAGDVTVAVTFADRRALTPRAQLIGQLSELGAEIAGELPFDEGYTEQPHAAPPRPDAVRARSAAGGARRWPGAVGVGRAARRGGGGRGRDRPPLAFRPRARRDRRRAPPSRPGRAPARFGSAGAWGSRSRSNRRWRSRRRRWAGP